MPESAAAVPTARFAHRPLWRPGDVCPLLVLGAGLPRLAPRPGVLVQVDIESRAVLLPGAPGWLAGVVHLRGTFLPAIDAAAWLGAAEPGAASRLLVLSGAGVSLALRCAESPSLATVSANDGPLPTSLPEALQEHVDGVLLTSAGPALQFDFAGAWQRLADALPTL